MMNNDTVFIALLISVTVFFCHVGFVCHNMNNTYQLYKKLKSLIPQDHQLMYITSLPSKPSGTMKCWIRKIYHYVMLIPKFLIGCFFCTGTLPKDFITNYLNTIIFDIDDSDNIIQAIKDASKNKLNLLIFVDSYGGDLISSDDICMALRTYQDIDTQGPGSYITCVVDNIAHSAATMIVLSADQINMSNFATLSPVDPQVNIIDDDRDYDVSSQLYADLDKCIIEGNMHVEADDFLIMKDRRNTYNDSIMVFKSLKQYRKTDNKNKQKILNVFCKNTISHHRSLNIGDLKKLGLDPQPVTENQLQILKVLKQCKDKS